MRHHSVGVGRSESHLVLVGCVASWDDDETLTVSLDPLYIDLETFLGSVLPPVVDWDSDRPGLLLSDTSSLELLERETSSGSDLGVVLDGGASYSWSERLKRSKSQDSSLLGSVVTTTRLGSGLVEPNLDSSLPVLAEMIVVENVVVPETHPARAVTMRERELVHCSSR